MLAIIPLICICAISFPSITKKVAALESTDITIAQQTQSKITNIGFTILSIIFLFYKV